MTLNKNSIISFDTKLRTFLHEARLILITGFCLLTILLFPPSTFAAFDGSGSGLMAYWNFDEGAGNVLNDSTSNNPGILENGPSWSSTSIYNSALSFDGSNDFVSLGNPSSLQPTSILTLSAWVYPTGQQSNNWGRIISKSNGGTGDNWAMIITQYNEVDCRIGGTSSRSARDLVNNTIWQHIACVYDGAAVKTYIDGIEVHSYVKTGAIPTDNDVTIGRNATAGNRYFKGVVDELRVYERALTAFEVVELMNYDPANQAPDTEAPTIPANLSLSSVTDTSVVLTWSPSTDNSAIIYYDIYRDSELHSSTTNTSFTDTALAPETTYTYYVTASDAAGNFSSSSVSIAATTLPTAPAEEALVTVSKLGAGSGIVTGIGIACGVDCEENVLVGAELTLSATPDVGHEFSGWSGICTGTDTCVFTVTSTTSITAVFSEIFTTPANPEAPTWQIDDPITDADAVTTTVVADFNNDGITDVAALEGGKHSSGYKLLAWFEGPTMVKHDLNPSFNTLLFTGSAFAADMNTDGAIDIVFSTDHHSGPTTEGYLYWAENPLGTANTTWSIHEIHHFISGAQHINDIEVTDIDGDGKLDVAIRHLNPTRVELLFQNSLTDWEIRSIDVAPREGMSIGDLDNDGNLDILLNGFWLAGPNDPRTGAWTRYDIDSAYFNQPDQGLNNAAKTNIADINDDGLLDVVISSAEGATAGLAWYQNTGATRDVGFIKHSLDASLGNAHQAELGDLDGDGDLDVVTGRAFGEDDVYAYYLTNDGGADQQTISSTKGLYFGKLGDLDGDGDLDIVGPNTYAGQLYVHWNQYIASSPPDETPPTINITNPANDAVISGMTNITAAANDNVAVDRVEFFVADVFHAADTTAPYEYSLETTTLTNAQHTVRADSFDAQGNFATQTITVTVDNTVPPEPDETPPTINITNPANDAVISGMTNIAAAANDNVAVDRVEFFVDDVFHAADTTAPYEYSLETTTLTDAQHTVRADSFDAQGNSATQTITVTVDNTVPPEPDETPPTINITNPANDAVISGMTNITVAANDNVAVDRVEFFVDDVFHAADTTAPYEYSLETTTLTDAQHTIRADSFDAQGNSATQTITVTVAVNAIPVSLAFDGFESGGFSAGSGAWAASWAAAGDVKISNKDQPHSGGEHVRLRRHSGLLQRPVNLLGAADVRLRFWAKVDSFENADSAAVRVSPDGQSFTTVKVLSASDSDDQYRFYEIDLSGFEMTSAFVIEFDAEMDSKKDNWYLDDIEIFGVP